MYQQMNITVCIEAINTHHTLAIQLEGIQVYLSQFISVKQRQEELIISLHSE